MKQFSFNTYLVDDSNRDAYNVCRRVADLQPVSPQPVLLLGDDGSGKTHLLYSIVNRIRSGPSKPGLAYITAHDFPERARALIDNPTKVSQAKSAVLLVDQVEQFQHHVEELEAVVRIFLDHGHYVVLASSVKPGRLTQLTEGLRAILQAGQTIHISGRPAETSLALLRLQAPPQSEEELALLRAQVATLTEALDQERAAKENLIQVVELAREQATRASVDEQDSDEAQVEREQHEAEIADLKRQLAIAREEGAKARNEADALVERATRLLAQVEQNRARFAELEQQHRGEAQAQARHAPGAGELDEAIEARDAMSETLAAREEELSTLQAELNARNEERATLLANLEQARQERARLAAALEQASVERIQLETNVEDARAETQATQEKVEAMEEAMAEREHAIARLQSDSEARIAKAYARAESAEQRARMLEQRDEELRRMGHETLSLLRQVESQMAGASAAVAHVSQRLRTASEALEEGAEAGSALDETGEEAGPIPSPLEAENQ